MIKAFGNRGYRCSLGRSRPLAQSDDRAQTGGCGACFHRTVGGTVSAAGWAASVAQQDELASFITSPPINQYAGNALRFPIMLERFISSGASLGCGYLRMYRVYIISTGPLSAAVSNSVDAQNAVEHYRGWNEREWVWSWCVYKLD